MNKKKLLLVDDEKDTLLVLEKQLTSAGYTVVTANSGTQALSLAKSEQPNLIVLDVQMPDMDGGEVAHKLKEDSMTKNIPVVYLTCLLSDSEDYKCGGNIMLAKSKGTKELIAVIDKVFKADTKLNEEASRIAGHVLVAEDVETNQVLMETLLNKMGIDVTIVEDGNQALQKALTNQFDLILMDMHMPHMNGYEATEALRKEGITTPIIALTANAMKGDNIKCHEAGCNEYLAKPIDQTQLVEMLDKYLSLNRQLLVETVDTAKSQVDKLTDLCLSEIPQKYDSEEMPCAKVSEEIINWDHLIALLGDEELINKIVPLFLKDIKERLDNLSDAIRSGDTKGIDFYGYTIKSAALTVGATRLSDIASLLEYAGRGNNLKLALPLFDKLKTELEKTTTFLSRKDWIEIAKQGKAVTGERFKNNVI